MTFVLCFWVGVFLWCLKHPWSRDRPLPLKWELLQSQPLSGALSSLPCGSYALHDGKIFWMILPNLAPCLGHLCQRHFGWVGSTQVQNSEHCCCQCHHTSTSWWMWLCTECVKQSPNLLFVNTWALPSLHQNSLNGTQKALIKPEQLCLMEAFLFVAVSLLQLLPVMVAELSKCFLKGMVCIVNFVTGHTQP